MKFDQISYSISQKIYWFFQFDHIHFCWFRIYFLLPHFEKSFYFRWSNYLSQCFFFLLIFSLKNVDSQVHSGSYHLRYCEKWCILILSFEIYSNLLNDCLIGNFSFLYLLSWSLSDRPWYWFFYLTPFLDFNDNSIQIYHGPYYNRFLMLFQYLLSQ